jgi:hypothetical protein
VKERPILFTGAMVRAILPTPPPKTQTRRLNGLDLVNANPSTWALQSLVDGLATFRSTREIDSDQTTTARCPYGVAGDRLWVRETIKLVEKFDEGAVSVFAADGELTKADAWPWKRPVLPSIHCPRGLSRITLDVTDVRVQRLQDISAADARAEGLKALPPNAPGGDRDMPAYVFPDSLYDRAGLCHGDPVDAYREGWNEISGPGSWDLNPHVWAISFRRVKP